MRTMAYCVLGALLIFGVLVSLTLSSAPDDADSFCTNATQASFSSPPPVHPPNYRVLLDSYHYINLLPPHRQPAWQMVDNDTNNVPGRGTEWTQNTNTPCRQNVNACGFSVGTQNNWLITQHIRRTVRNYTRVSVQVEFELRGCDSADCRRSFAVYKYESSELNPSEARNINRFQLVGRVAAEDITGQTKQNRTVEVDLDTDEDGFYLAIVDETTCIGVTRVIVFYTVCPGGVVNLVNLPETLAPSNSINVLGECVDDARPENGAIVTLSCSQGGEWLPIPGAGCRCNPGLEVVDGGQSCADVVTVGPWDGRTAHGITGTITLTTPTTLVIEDFSFDNGGIVVFFYYYPPGQPVDGRSGIIIPIPSPEGGFRGELNRRYRNEQLVVPLPRGVTACDIGTLTIWDEPFLATFSRVVIPRSLFVNNGEGGDCKFLINSPLIEFERDVYEIYEDIGLNDFALRVCFKVLNLPSPRNITVSTVPQTADDMDFLPLKRELYLINSDTRQCVSVIILEDNQTETDENFLVTVENIGVSTEVTILDDDDITFNFTGNSPIVRNDVVTFQLSLGGGIIGAKCAVLQKNEVLREQNCSSGRAVFTDLPLRFVELTPRITLFSRNKDVVIAPSQDTARNFRLTIGSRRRCSVHLINEGVTYTNRTGSIETSIEWGLSGPSDVILSDITYTCSLNGGPLFQCAPPFRTSMQIVTLRVRPPQNSAGCIRGIPHTFRLF